MLKRKRGVSSKKTWLGFTAIVFVFTLFFPSFLITTTRAEASVVWTDKKEYFPDEVASIFGYGFNPFADVEIQIVRPDLVEDVIFATADEFGYFCCEYQLDGVHGTYSLTAADGVNVATTTFDNWLYLKAKWDDYCCWYINVRASGLRKSKSYYVKYFDPAGEERRKSPTYTGVTEFVDSYTVLPSLPDILGKWTVKLYKDSTRIRTRSLCIDKMVWTTDSTYNNLVISFNQSETVYFKAIGLKTDKYYRFMFKTPSGTKIYVGDWTTGVTTLTGSYTLPSDAETGSWKLHVREAYDSSGTCEHHYVDTCYFEVTTAPPPPQYHLTVRTAPPDITTISGEGWYDYCETVTLTAPELVSRPSGGIRYKFFYWDVDDVPRDEGVNPIEVHMDDDHIATAHYLVQYYLNVTADPLDVTIPAGSGWYNESDYASIFAPEFVSIVPGESRYRFDGWTTTYMSEIVDPDSPSTTVLMDKDKTVTANYVVQYLVTFNQTGLDNTAVGTVGTVDSVPKTFDDLPFSMWVDSGSTVAYSYSSTVSSTVSGKRFVLIDVTGPSSPITVTSAVTVAGNYKVQYLLTVRTSGLGTYTTDVYNGTDVIGTATDATPYTGWFDEGSLIQLDIDSPITVDSQKFIFTHWSGDASGSDRPISLTMSSTKDITANYKAQYLVTFDHTGLDATANSVVVTVNGAPKNFGDLPFSFWADEEDTVTYSYSSIVTSTVSGKRFSLIDITGPSSPITVTASVTVSGNYKIQYEVTFDQSGVGSDYTGTVVNVDGTDYGVGELPVSFWWDEDSAYDFAFQSPLLVSPEAKRYVWASTSGLSTLQSGSLIVSTSGSVTGNYRTQYYLTVTSPHGSPTPTSGWFDAETEITASVTSPCPGPTDVQYVCIGWTGTGNVPDSGTATSVTFTINESSSIIWNWKTQYYLTVQTDPPGVTTIPGEDWYDYCETVTLTAPSVSGYSFVTWKVDGEPVSGYSIEVHMDEPHTATAHYKAIAVPVGGYSVSLTQPTEITPLIGYTMILAIFGAVITLFRRKRK